MSACNFRVSAGVSRVPAVDFGVSAGVLRMSACDLAVIKSVSEFFFQKIPKKIPKIPKILNWARYFFVIF